MRQFVLAAFVVRFRGDFSFAADNCGNPNGQYGFLHR
jgi:hypothetical protein